MRFTVGFNIKCWMVGFNISDKIPLAGYVDGVEYMAAVENTLVVFCLGPLAFRIWFGPQPQETA